MIQIALAIWYLVVFTMVMGSVIIGLVLLTPDKPDSVGYDCQLAEISPDVPLAYKQACREARRNK
jgi:hypothetical protein